VGALLVPDVVCKSVVVQRCCKDVLHLLTIRMYLPVANCPVCDWDPSSPLAMVEMPNSKVDIHEIEDLTPPPLGQESKTYVTVFPSPDNGPQPKARHKRRRDSRAPNTPQTLKKSHEHNNSRLCGRPPADKHAEASVSDPATNTAVTHTNQTIRGLLEEKGYQIIADHQADKLADSEKETRNQEVSDVTAGASVAGDIAALKSQLPTDEEIMQYFPNIASAFNKGSSIELRNAIEHILAPNAVFRTHSIRLPGADNTPFADRIIAGMSTGILNCYY
jgi:hypothetical protein